MLADNATLIGIAITQFVVLTGIVLGYMKTAKLEHTVNSQLDQYKIDADRASHAEGRLEAQKEHGYFPTALEIRLLAIGMVAGIGATLAWWRFFRGKRWGK